MQPLCRFLWFVFQSLLAPTDCFLSGTDGKALSPEAAAAGGCERADAIGLVFFQQFAAAAKQAGRIHEFMYALTKGLILFAIPDLAETLPADIPKGVMPDAAFVVA